MRVEHVDFLGARVALVREAQVASALTLADALEDLRAAFADEAAGAARNAPRVRVPSREGAWLHTLRAGWAGRGLVGGKDYASLGFELPAMWVTLVSVRSGKPLAFIEADLLSRVRTAAVTALATERLAPPDARVLAHFGAGKISELLVRAALLVRPSIERVLLVRRDESKGAPEWLADLETRSTRAEMTSASAALNAAELVTTATSSVEPVLPALEAMPRLAHLNLVGSNHKKRREIGPELALALLQRGFVCVDDPAQAALEAGDFLQLGQEAPDWSALPTLARVVAEPGLAGARRPTAFESLGTGLADLAVAAGVLARLGLAGSA